MHSFIIKQLFKISKDNYYYYKLIFTLLNNLTDKYKKDINYTRFLLILTTFY